MATCQDATNTLSPFQILLDKTDKDIATLERQAYDILPVVQEFREGLGFDPNELSPTQTVIDAMNEFTKEAICASKTDLVSIDRFIEDCLNDILLFVKKYANNILGNVENGIDLIDDILSLAEYIYMKLLQKLWRLCRDIRNLVAGLDRKLSCIVTADQQGIYTAQVVALQDRIDTVIEDLYLAEDGSFDHTKLMTDFNAGLQSNLNLFYNRSVELQQEILDDIDDTINAPNNVNPTALF